MKEESSVRLNKLLALRLGTSRRESDDMIADGRVIVDGTVAGLGARVHETADILVDGKAVATETEHQYVLFNKPVGYVCSRKAQGDNPTIYELLPKDFARLKPVGRLDKDSSGVLLLTNDGDLAHTMTHPSFRKVKIYHVDIATPLEPLHQQMISDYGVEIGDGVSKLELTRENDERTSWTVTMHEGRNRQIRRTFAALGYEVTRLHRTVFGAYDDAGLKSGEYRSVNA